MKITHLKQTLLFEIGHWIMYVFANVTDIKGLKTLKL